MFSRPTRAARATTTAAGGVVHPSAGTVRRRHARRGIASAATAAVFALALAACSSGATASQASGTAGTDGVTTGGTLTYLEYQAFTTLYPPAAGFYPNSGVVNQITARLTYQDPETLEISPWVATSWEVNDDATVYTFHLRDDVTFSDGTPLDAAAVAANFDLYGTGDPARGFAVSEQINNYTGAKVIDPTTVEFDFSAPSPGFLQATSALQAGLLSPQTLEGDSDLFAPGNAAKVIGAGPFVITDEDPGVSWTFKAREDYDWAPPALEHQGRAYLDEIDVVVTPEDNVRVGALTSGQADYVRYVQAYDEQTVEAAGLDLYAPQTKGVNNSLSLRFTNHILSDLRVRQAIVHGIDTQEIVDTIYTDSYPRATSPLSKSALGYVDLSSELTFDPQQSAALLDEAGWVPGADGIRVKDGEKLTLVASEAKPQPLSKESLTLIAQQLKKIGVDLQILAADSGTFAEAIKDPEQVALYHSMVGRADYDVIKSQYHSKNRDTLLSNDAQLDALLEKVASTPDAADRAAASAEVQKYLVDQAYVVPIFEEPQVFGAQPYVKGITFDPVARPDFYSTWLDK